MIKLLKLTTLVLAIAFISTTTQLAWNVAISNSGVMRSFSINLVGDMISYLRSGEIIRMSGSYTPLKLVDNCTSAVEIADWIRVGRVVSVSGSLSSVDCADNDDIELSVPIFPDSSLTGKWGRSLTGVGTVNESGGAGTGNWVILGDEAGDPFTVRLIYKGVTQSGSLGNYMYQYRIKD